MRETKTKKDRSKAQEVFNEMQGEVARVAKDYYEMALNSGIAKEQARALLPEGLTKLLYIWQELSALGFISAS